MIILFDGEHGASDTLRFIEEKGRMGLWAWDLRTRKMEWSFGLYKLLGLTSGTTAPSFSKLHALLNPADVGSPEEAEQILVEEGSIERECRIVRSDGRVRWVINRAEVLVNEDGMPFKIIGIVLSSPRVHEALLTAEAAQERCAGLIEAASAIVWAVDAAGMAGDSPSWRKFTGQGVTEVQGRGWLNAAHSDDRNSVCNAWDLAIINRSPFKCEFRLRRGDGVYRWVRAKAVPVSKKDGSLREWIGVCIDIHDHKAWVPPDHATRITGAQLRAARGLLNWSVRDIADAATMSAATIRRLEETDGPLPEQDETMRPIVETFEKAGVEFLFPPLGKPGVRPH